MNESRAVVELRSQWQPHDPALRAELPDAATQERQLQRILYASHLTLVPPAPTVRAGRLRRTIFAAAGAVAIGGVLVVANPAQGPAFAVTPPPLALPAGAPAPAAPVLRELALRAEQSSSGPRAGATEHLKRSEWSLFTSVDDETNSAVVPTLVESWRAPDGSGRVVQGVGEPIVDSASLRDRITIWWEINTEEPRAASYQAGQYPAVWRADRPPVETAALRSWLLRNRPEGGGPSDVITAVRDLVRERALNAAERAALLRVLAATPGLEHTGMVVERAGRRGDGFRLLSDDSASTAAYLLVIDPGDGRILAAEETLLSGADGLNIRTPAVISYETFLISE
ncbi:CU044_5270 family protein [Pilimelia columellifera]|uniref:CU044_5270 family protein n=1 Tax=Pilimelia columellifera subsp. columellifera TaxID=706583 RepID=A0ABN3NMT1_9ACTN